MTIIFLLIPLGLVLVGAALWAFFWAVGDGQFDDLESPGWSVVADDTPALETPIDGEQTG
ncbi:MAG: cbb3-type cytochrome oxidase assembly protein CcoS [Pseudomonadota bacterium]|jgi:cbb3-type cytochrome oxidase maturation protein